MNFILGLYYFSYQEILPLIRKDDPELMVICTSGDEIEDLLEEGKSTIISNLNKFYTESLLVFSFRMIENSAQILQIYLNSVDFLLNETNISNLNILFADNKNYKPNQFKLDGYIPTLARFAKIIKEALRIYDIERRTGIPQYCSTGRRDQWGRISLEKKYLKYKQKYLKLKKILEKNNILI